MVLEIADIAVADDAVDGFVESYQRAREHLASSTGLRSIRMTQGVETPTRFVLLVEWDSVDAHDDFRASDRFDAWRALISPHFQAPPHVEHVRDIA